MAPEGVPDTVRFTVCAEPLVVAVLIVDEPLVFCASVRLVGLALIEKSLVPPVAPAASRAIFQTSGCTDAGCLIVASGAGIEQIVAAGDVMVSGEALGRIEEAIERGAGAAQNRLAVRGQVLVRSAEMPAHSGAAALVPPTAIQPEDGHPDAETVQYTE